MSLVAAGACTAAGTEAQAGDRLHRDARGFELRLPAGWSVAPDPTTGRVDVLAGGGGRVVIWPHFVPGRGRVHEPAVLRHLAKRIWPQASWSGGATTILRGRLGDTDRIAATLAARGSAAGTAMVFYAVQGPVERYAAVGAAAEQILASVRFIGPDESVAAPPAVEFVRWTDRRESAFSVDVPKGWRVEGGAFRYAPVDVRPAVEIRSGDGAIVVRLGDASLPTFVEPMPFFPEGSTYAPYGTAMGVRRRPSPSAFLRWYVESSAAAGCRPRIEEPRDRADAVQAINDVYRRSLPMASLDASDVGFTCGDRTGYYFAGLQTLRMGGPALWKVEYLLGYTAPPARAAEAEAAMVRLMDSFQINPQWMAMQQGINSNTSTIVAQAGDAIAKTISSSYWSKQSVESELARRRSNATLGIEDVRDELGNTYRVESGANHYWINPRGTIVGTDIDATPRGDFRALVRW